MNGDDVIQAYCDAASTLTTRIIGGFVAGIFPRADVDALKKFYLAALENLDTRGEIESALNKLPEYRNAVRESVVRIGAAMQLDATGDHAFQVHLSLVEDGVPETLRKAFPDTGDLADLNEQMVRYFRAASTLVVTPYREGDEYKFHDIEHVVQMANAQIQKPGLA